MDGHIISKRVSSKVIILRSIVDLFYVIVTLQNLSLNEGTVTPTRGTPGMIPSKSFDNVVPIFADTFAKSPHLDMVLVLIQM